MKMHLSAAILATLLTAVLAGTALAQTSTAPTAATQPGPGWSALESYTGTIVQIDPAARLVTTRDARGITIFEAPPSMAS